MAFTSSAYLQQYSSNCSLAAGWVTQRSTRHPDFGHGSGDACCPYYIFKAANSNLSLLAGDAFNLLGLTFEAFRLNPHGVNSRHCVSRSIFHL